MQIYNKAQLDAIADKIGQAIKAAKAEATTLIKGIVQLNSSTNSTSTTQAATPSAVKQAYDLANSAIPSSEKGAINGVASLDNGGKVPSAQLPSMSSYTAGQGLNLTGSEFAVDFNYQSQRISPTILGTQTANTASWTGNSEMPELISGQQITFWLNKTSAANVTLNLKLKNGTFTGAIPVYFTGTTRLATQYPAGSIVTMVYLVTPEILGIVRATGWYVDNYVDTNTTYLAMSAAEAQAGTATVAKLIAPNVLKAGIVEHAIPNASKGAANGVASLDAAGKVLAAQLPETSGGGGATLDDGRALNYHLVNIQGKSGIPPSYPSRITKRVVNISIPTESIIVSINLIGGVSSLFKTPRIGGTINTFENNDSALGFEVDLSQGTLELSLSESEAYYLLNNAAKSVNILITYI